ncbi:MAG TPA: hypothetical protein VM470_02000 [Acidimicrobiia bacterium]|nr:hypothetical protein [Acidimicrobiia bacterium]
MPMKRITPGLLAVFAMLAAACGGEAADTTTSSAESSTTTVAPSTSTTQAATTTTAGPATTTTAGPTTTNLAGEPIDFGPAEGDVVAVIGVRHDDVLNLRDAPGADQPISEEIPPTFNDLVARGNTRNLPSAFWIEVDYKGTVGWVHMGFIAFEGAVTDETASVVDELGERPVEATMADLGQAVAEVFASDEEPESDIVQVTPGTSGDLPEITYDVIGLGDDAVRGLRIHVFAEKVSGGFSLRTVEVTALCGRGVTEDGACV